MVTGVQQLCAPGVVVSTTLDVLLWPPTSLLLAGGGWTSKRFHFTVGTFAFQCSVRCSTKISSVH